MTALLDRQRKNNTSNVRVEGSLELLAADVMNIPDALLNKVKYVSFDCFDTILWRRTAKPVDMFFLLQDRPLFKKIGMTANLRVKAEDTARRLKSVTQQSHEVTLADIYRAYSANLTSTEINALMDQELQEEIQTCFAFQPVVDFIKKLITLNIKLVITSDTYLTSNQLRQLLAAHLPDEIMKAFSQIFVSSQFGYNKSSGLHVVVLRQLNIRPSEILHIGDNNKADFIAPQELQIPCVYLKQYHPEILAMNRMRELSLGILMPAIRCKVPLYHTFKSLIASEKFTYDQPEKYVGYACLGPLMYAFSHYIKAEYESLKSVHPNVKLLFLLRDAHLPAQVCAVLENSPEGIPVRVSRFASYAASFRSKENIIEYLSGVIAGGRYADICKQLLLEPEISDSLIEKAKLSDNVSKAFTQAILNETITKKIINHSRLYCARLRQYLAKQAGIVDGDTIVLVDLGYTGTTQLRLAPIFKNEFNITLIGRYLLSLPTPFWQDSKEGLIDPNNCDENTLFALVSYIALLEQLCTTTDKSVVDFGEGGEPIYGDVSLNADQYQKLTQIQAACVQFAKTAEKQRMAGHLRFSRVELEQTAIAEIARLLYLPTRIELDYLKTFKFDLNLGTNDLLDMFDAEKGLDSLCKRGLFFMEKNLKTMRTNYPAELRYLGLELLVMLLAQHRHGLEFNVSDMSFRTQQLDLIIMNAASQSTHTAHAAPTYDGYFSCVIPAADHCFLGIAFGKHYRWLQIRSIEVIPLDSLYKNTESQHTVSIMQDMITDQMVCRGGDLYECLSPAGLVMLQPTGMTISHVYRVIFRPIV